jgi:hypothetical protein
VAPAWEDIDWRGSRGLHRELIAELVACNLLRDGRSILLTGASGSRKTWLACALGRQAARQGYSVLYTRTSRLLEAGGSLKSGVPLAGTLVDPMSRFACCKAHNRDPDDPTLVPSDSCIHWYDEARINMSLGFRSPIDHRRNLGPAAVTSPSFPPHPRSVRRTLWHSVKSEPGTSRRTTESALRAQRSPTI